MSGAFAGSSYWLALLNPRDQFHDQAVRLECPSVIVTTRAVQLEVLDALCVPFLRPLGGRFWRDTNADPGLEVVSLTDELLQRAAGLYQRRPDKA